MLPWLALLALAVPAPCPELAQGKIPEPKDVAVEPGTPHAWMLSCSAVLFERNHDRHDLLAGQPMSASVGDEARETLAK